MSMQELDLPLNRDLFFRTMIRSFAKSLEETVGLDEAAGYVSIVGSEVGEWIERQYQDSRIVEALARQIGGTLDRKSDAGGTTWTFVFPHRPPRRTGRSLEEVAARGD